MDDLARFVSFLHSLHSNHGPVEDPHEVDIQAGSPPEIDIYPGIVHQNINTINIKVLLCIVKEALDFFLFSHITLNVANFQFSKSFSQLILVVLNLLLLWCRLRLQASRLYLEACWLELTCLNVIACIQMPLDVSSSCKFLKI